ncbi:MAG: hypothetical protein FI679_02365 [SAR202 cluster bacterium]|jgi:predicted  nucleic acid-binding Zn-ribbon protein|nr:hypothetical protein [SAR202 cluster bacterium]|tara:strand:+ start:28350 stop:29042 length:693 start_codon:yes stop_codon:yes gene_type:complete
MKSLIELQSVDLLMDSCLKEISFIENEINDNSRLVAIQTKINQLQKNIDILNKALNQLNISIETNNSKILSLETRLYGGEITNNKQSEATAIEIDLLKSQTTEYEEKSLQCIIKLEPYENELKNTSLIFESAKTEKNDSKKHLQIKLENLYSKRNTLQQEQSYLLKTVDKAYLEKYLIIRKRKPNAVGLTEKGICSACNVKLPTGELNLLKQSSTISYCKTCGAIIFYIS